MKIAYVAQVDADREDGVTKKIHAQVVEWQAQGCDVRLYFVARREGRWQGWAELNANIEVHDGGRSRFVASNRVARQVIHWSPDLVYFRMGPCYPAFRKLASLFPTVVEQNSLDLAEIRLRLGIIKVAYHRVTRRALMRHVRGIVAVSNELLGAEEYAQPKLIEGNGISLSEYAPFPPAENVRPRLVFMGARKAAWHGVDKIAVLARRFRDWHFDIIGEVWPNGETPPPNIRLHGHLSSDRYNELLAKADIALGTLALHRKGMHEASPLKTREYLARGIPTVIAYRDTDFPTSVPYLLELPNSPDNVSANFDAIERFVVDWKGRRIPREAVGHIDTRIKEMRRLKFFSRIVQVPEL